MVISGNLYLGPINRGPSDDEESGEKFYYDIKPIVSSSHFQDLLDLFNNLKKFVRQASEMTPFERLINGFNLFTSMTITLRGYGIILMDDDKWEERELTSRELERLGKSKLK